MKTDAEANPSHHLTALITLFAVTALSFGAILLSTNHGVGAVRGSMPIVEAAREHRVLSDMQAYSFFINHRIDAKHDAPATTRIPMAICLAAGVLVAGLTVYLIRRDGILATLTALLVASAPGVLRSATILRPEPLILIASLATLYAADAFGRKPALGLLFATVLLAAVTTVSAYIGGLVIVAAIVSIITAYRESKFAWGHLVFAGLYAIVAACLGARTVPLYSPSIAALCIFFATVARKPGAILATAASLVLTIPWVIHAQRDGHDFASPEWKHSPTMLGLVHLPKGSVFYSNAPEAVALHDRHSVHPLPGVDDAVGLKAMTETLTHQESFVVWFNAAQGDIKKIESHVPLQEYEAWSDGALYRATPSAWRGGSRRIAFNPDTASTPVRRAAGNNEVWNKKHAQYVAQAAKGGIDLLFLGDSITDDYRTVSGAWQFFQDRYGPYHPANFGIDGDHTQHLLYRIEAGECDHISPKVAIILIGTNNTADDSPAAIAKGIEACVQATRQKLPTTRILLLGLFPRGGSPDHNDKRAVIQKVNQLIAPLDNGDTIRFLNLYDRFLEPDGTLSKDVMYDSLHPSLKGYHIWADAMQPLLDQMMKAPAMKPEQPTTRSF